MIKIIMINNSRNKSDLRIIIDFDVLSSTLFLLGKYKTLVFISVGMCDRYIRDLILFYFTFLFYNLHTFLLPFLCKVISLLPVGSQ